MNLPATTRLPVPTHWWTDFCQTLAYCLRWPHRRDTLDTSKPRERTFKDAALRTRNNMDRLWKDDKIDFPLMLAEFEADGEIIYKHLRQFAQADGEVALVEEKEETE